MVFLEVSMGFETVSPGSERHEILQRRLMGPTLDSRLHQQWGHISTLLHTISITAEDTTAKGTFDIIAVISWTLPRTPSVSEHGVW
ncbi:hypothetical protein EYF80_023213 [Liparis tanakae]|uniref:Uncharacterized protein n=1 Tax=Liparis tanakae TaxID=230148 RepID=A0A4Z2HLB1_9TELE|nr:hypothetical protein EYF80_023213 [Liparis tanakae]